MRNIPIVTSIALIVILPLFLSVSFSVESANTVLKAQKKLIEIGYDPGPLDGVVGKKTEMAIRKFQRDHDLSVTGQLDEQTVEKLGLNEPSLKESGGKTFMTYPPGSAQLFSVDNYEIYIKNIDESKSTFDFGSINYGKKQKVICNNWRFVKEKGASQLTGVSLHLQKGQSFGPVYHVSGTFEVYIFGKRLETSAELTGCKDSMSIFYVLKKDGTIILTTK